MIASTKRSSAMNDPVTEPPELPIEELDRITGGDKPPTTRRGGERPLEYLKVTMTEVL
jgi:hypothetical protein